MSQVFLPGKEKDEARKPFIVPVFIPHEGCPHRCVFCDQSAITGQRDRMPSKGHLKTHIQTYLKHASPHRHPVQISFYGGTFLGLTNEVICDLLSLARDFVQGGQVHGIRFSTRPDSVTEEKLELIRPFPVTTVELGVQSMDSGVLTLSGRGHGPEHTEKASALLSARGYETGFQIMAGLPGDDMEKSLETVKSLCRRKPSFMRIYPTLVLRGSALERLYEKKTYVPLTLDQAVARVKRLYLYIRGHGIPVIRMGLQASEELDNGSVVVAGPYHPSFGHLVHSAVFLDMAIRILRRETGAGDRNKTVFYVHSRNISKLRGLKNQNLDVLRALFYQDGLRVVADDRLDLETVKTDRNTMTISDLDPEDEEEPWTLSEP